MVNPVSVFEGPGKGQSIKLNYSLDGKQRLLIGLSWDAVEGKWITKTKTPELLDESASFLASVSYYLRNLPRDFYEILRTFFAIFHVRAGNKKEDRETREEKYSHFDLDLYAYIFDESGTFVTRIGPETEDIIDQSETIYHSGENTSGYGGPDDEQIFVHFRDLPENYHHIFILVTSDSKYSLDEVNDLIVRVADGKTNTEFFKTALKPSADLNAYAAVCARIYKGSEGWYIENVTDFTDFDQDWPVHLKRYI